MSPDPLPDFHHALMLSRGGLKAGDLAECHGVLCGMICGENGRTAEDFLAHLGTLQVAVEAGSPLRDVMMEAFDSTCQQLADEELRFNLWLPDDDQPLEERTESLGQWCTGFLAGLGLGGPLQPLSAEASEALEDLRQIAQASYVGQVMDDSGEMPDPEDDEKALFEVAEYVRMVTLVLREELRGPGVNDPIH